MVNSQLRAAKERQEARKNQKVINLKEVRLSPTIDEHDFKQNFVMQSNSLKKAIKLKLYSF